MDLVPGHQTEPLVPHPALTADAPQDRRKGAVADLEGHLGHRFKDRELLERALTHSSAGEGARRLRDNERLEFLGDRVLNLLAAERLTELYPDEREGELTKRMHGLINREACARTARRVGLTAALRLAGGESRRGGRDNPSILGDACEALLAALYLDAGLERTRDVFARIWADEFELVAIQGAPNPKSELQEWAAARKLEPPSYRVAERRGPAHAPTFTVELRLGELAPVSASGPSRRAAEKTAAQMMLDREVGHGG
jgi:ribonuclease III